MKYEEKAIAPSLADELSSFKSYRLEVEISDNLWFMLDSFSSCLLSCNIKWGRWGESTLESQGNFWHVLDLICNLGSFHLDVFPFKDIIGSNLVSHRSREGQ